MRLKIKEEKCGSGFGIGVDDKNNDYLVFGGDLCYGSEVNVDIIKDSNKYILSVLNYDENSLFLNYYDSDNLIDFKKLKEVKEFSRPFKRIYELDGFWVFIPHKTNNIVEYLYENNLIKSAKIKITRNHSHSSSGAPIITVNYQTILSKVLDSQSAISAWYYCEKSKRDPDKNIYADLYIKGDKNEGKLQIQMWNVIDSNLQVSYAHFMMNEDNSSFIHFDLAIHHIHDLEEISNFLKFKKKMETTSREKWIKIDTRLDENDIFSMVRLFFPLSHLIDEFCEEYL